MNPNPYASPVDTERGKYDHSDILQFVRFCIVFAAFLLLVDLILLNFGPLRSSQVEPSQVVRQILDGDIQQLIP